ncbi:histone family protein DNA-binding protein [Hyphomonas johnsonii MHS-2]|uniref:Histone family protein DNA-binding protein n=1 Tax=Hyphomonas johnsonii MHS-2 TaxID=1280950 RepID=A0A059FJP6_9PROT|nr:HU family DNA-binding protein [Hyphomonas johnsonii]KCZ90698.1 histone family protein DNA-binding protein [Hyphomonas johnsonii MHS-2]
MAMKPAAKKAAAKPAATKTAVAKKPSVAKKPAAKAAAKPAAKAKPAAAPAKAATKTAPTVTLRQMSVGLAETHGLTKKQAQEIFDDMATQITKRLKKGERIRLNGLGTLEVRKRPARMGRNPATGEAIKIKASKKVAFRVAKELKETV